MGRTITAFPWGGIAFSAPTISGYGQKIKDLISFDKLTYQRTIQSFAILHLFGIEVLTLRADVLPITLFFSATGLILILLTLSKNFISDVKSSKSHSVSIEQSELQLQAHELILRSKTFLDVASSTSRTQSEQETRDELWSEVTARISHELRTPLNAVIGFTDLMRSETFGPLGHERYRDYIEHIQDCCKDLLKSTENTLGLASTLGKGGDKHPASRISLFKKIRQLAELHKGEIHKRNIRLQLLEDPSLEIVGEEDQIDQILFNIFVEGLSRVDNNQTLEIRTEYSENSLALNFRILFPKKKIRFEQSSLELCIARVLLEKQHSRLIIIDEKEIWHAQILLERAHQDEVSHFKISA